MSALGGKRTFGTTALILVTEDSLVSVGYGRRGAASLDPSQTMSYMREYLLTQSRYTEIWRAPSVKKSDRHCSMQRPSSSPAWAQARPRPRSQRRLAFPRGPCSPTF